jgi:acyl-CoA-binding protein
MSDKKFEKACEKAKNLKNLNNNDMGDLYGLFKQATNGDCNIKKPGFLNMKECAKYDAWKKLEGLSQDDAKIKYTKKVKSLCKNESD